MLRRSLTIGVSAALCFIASPQDAIAADACIAPKTIDSLSACPNTEAKPVAGHHPLKIGAPVRPLAPTKDNTKAPPPDTANTAVQIRRALATVRGTQLLVTQIQGLESLLAATAKTSPDRPVLIRRLADSYVELESSAFRTKTESRMKASQIKQASPEKTRLLAEADKAEKIEKSARQAAIKQYTVHKNDYPRWCQSPNPKDQAKSSGCVDEVLYDLAYEYEQEGNLNDARKAYLDLIQSAPGSKYIPNAYLAFGELFFNEAQGDPSKWALAEQSYKEVIRYPAPANTALGYAHYKLAYVYWNKGDFAQAMSELKKTIDHGAQFPLLPNAKELASTARRDLVPLYALSGDPKKAYDFFHPLSGEPVSETAVTYKLMGELGQSYLDTGHYAEAIALYQDLMNRDRGPKACEYQGHIGEAVLAMRSGDKGAIKAELDRQIDVLQKTRNGSASDDIKLACANTTAELVVETAMAWHLEAVGDGGVRGTGDKKTMDLAAALYDGAVKTFSRDDFEKLSFPKIVKEDWPSLLKIKYEMADLLYFQKNWAKCGPAFDAVVLEQPNGPLAAEAAYASSICYQNLYNAAHEGHSDRAGLGRATRNAEASFTPRDLTDPEKAMVGSFNRYVCAVKPAASDKEGQERLVEVKYARARTYFDARHWEEAAAGFRDVAMNHAGSEAGIFAAQLYLESINVMATHGTPPREACYDDLGKDVPRFVELYCKGDKAKDNADQCGMLQKIERDTERLSCERLVTGAKGDDAASLASLEKGANCYFGLWTKYGEKACEAKQPGCERMDEILYNSAKAFQAARLLAKSIAVRKILVDPRYTLDHTDLARKSLKEIGGNYQAIAVYDEAASWYERFARENPKMEGAAEALEDATVLRLGVGQEDQAIKDADSFQHSYGSQKPALAAKVAFAIGAHYIEREDFDKARKHLSSAMRAIDDSAAVDVKLAAHAMLGRALAKTVGAGSAAAEYAKVRALFKDPEAVMKQIAPTGGADVDAQRRLAKALNAVGEALFFSAEQRRREVDRIRFPEYRGSGKRDDVLHHIRTKVADWIQKKRPAIEETEREYLKIKDLRPAPPAWVIAAGSRVGQMWGKFVAEFRAAPIPKEWTQNGPSNIEGLTWEEIRGEYYRAIDEASEPQRLRAKAAYQACLDYSVKFQHFDDHSRTCEVWLSKNYGSEFHILDELRGAPTRVGTQVDPRPAPIGLALTKPGDAR